MDDENDGQRQVRLDAAGEAGARGAGDGCGIRLYVEHENAGAQATYEALGMQPAHYRMYEVEFDGKTSGPSASKAP